MTVDWRINMAWSCLLVAFFPGILFAVEDEKFSADDLTFFEKKIRPVLVEHCQKCHSAEAAATNQLKGSLFVDSRAGLLKGGDSGPAVVPGNVDDSLLLDALRFESFQMPPKGKLPAKIISDFEEWIQRGAADPRQESPELAQRKPKAIDVEAGRKFWCYQPIANPAIPAVSHAKNMGRNAIDAFIGEKLAANQLSPAGEAAKATLARRVYFDLTGLPPRPDELDAFVQDPAPDAYEQLVERLLASPRFGERWGRHWLDVSRYAESLTLRGFVMPEAWRYRDYVVNTFNQDRSFADFMREQVSGDLLSTTTMAERSRNLIATAFLTLGNTNLEEQDKGQLRMDVVDEQLETIGKGFLAQTIGCARCHDHKFDPIPTRDYYALAGILRNSKTLENSNVSKWLEFPLPVDPEQDALLKKHETLVDTLQTKIKSLKDAIKLASSANPNSKAPATAATTTGPAVASNALAGIVVDDTQAKIVGEWKVTKYSRGYVGEGYLQDLNKGKGEKTVTFVPDLPHSGKYEVRLSYTGAVNRAEDVPVTIFSADGEKVVHVNQKIPAPIDNRFVSLGQYRFEQNGQGFVIISNEGTSGHVIADAVQFLPLDSAPETASGKNKKGKASAENTKLVSDNKKSDDVKDAAKPEVTKPDVTKPDAATPVPAADVAESREKELKAMEKELKALNDHGPKRPMYMSVKEEAKIDDTHVHVRGSVHNLGEKVPRGFLQVASYGERPSVSVNESGRRELGDWLASADNPLPARVMANRVWHWVFGVGLVRTTDNFGTTGETPSHPELLDHLATCLIQEDWSVKSLVREMVLSHTYRQASAADKKQRAADPENRLLSHMNRRRMDAECLLDTVLTVSGDLRLEVGGKSYKNGLSSDYNYKHDVSRRAIYWPSFRNSIPELLEVFDVADPSMVMGNRNVSTVSPQALFMMNDDWIITQSKRAAGQLLSTPALEDGSRVQQAYRLALGRAPTEVEQKLALNYIRTTSADDKEKKDSSVHARWAQLFQALFASIDFRYIE